MTDLQFNPVGHQYLLNNRPVPSVTQVLQPYSGLEFVDREVLARAAEFGTHVHEACHLLNLGRLDADNLDEALVPYVQAWAQFLEDTGAVVVLSEHRVASEAYNFAGTIDTIVHWGKSSRLVDIKSTSGVPRTVGPQTAAYRQALKESTGDSVRDRYCVQLKPDGRYALHKLTDPNDWNIFQSALNLHRWYYASHNGRTA